MRPAEVVSIFKNKAPAYRVYRPDTLLSPGGKLMLQRMGMRWFEDLKCWTNAPDSWGRKQIEVLLAQEAASL